MSTVQERTNGRYEAVNPVAMLADVIAALELPPNATAADVRNAIEALLSPEAAAPAPEPELSRAELARIRESARVAVHQAELARADNDVHARFAALQAERQNGGLVPGTAHPLYADPNMRRVR